MNAKLSSIRDWEGLAVGCGYQARALADHCGVCPRQLERFFQRAKGETPKAWLEKTRLRHAARLLNDGYSIKEVICLLGYRDRSHFSRRFKLLFGWSPCQVQGRRRSERSALDVRTSSENHLPGCLCDGTYAEIPVTAPGALWAPLARRTVWPYFLPQQ